MTTLAFFSPGPMEMGIIGIIAVLLFGNRLPGVARAFGSTLNAFKSGLIDAEGVADDLKDSIKAEADDVNDTVKGK